MFVLDKKLVYFMYLVSVCMIFVDFFGGVNIIIDVSCCIVVVDYSGVVVIFLVS